MEWTDLNIGDVCSITFTDGASIQLISEVVTKTDTKIEIRDIISSDSNLETWTIDITGPYLSDLTLNSVIFHRSSTLEYIKDHHPELLI